MENRNTKGKIPNPSNKEFFDLINSIPKTSFFIDKPEKYHPIDDACKALLLYHELSGTELDFEFHPDFHNWENLLGYLIEVKNSGYNDSDFRFIKKENGIYSFIEVQYLLDDYYGLYADGIDNIVEDLRPLYARVYNKLCEYFYTPDFDFEAEIYEEFEINDGTDPLRVKEVIEEAKDEIEVSRAKIKKYLEMDFSEIKPLDEKSEDLKKNLLFLMEADFNKFENIFDYENENLYEYTDFHLLISPLVVWGSNELQDVYIRGIEDLVNNVGVLQPVLRSCIDLNSGVITNNIEEIQLFTKVLESLNKVLVICHS